MLGEGRAAIATAAQSLECLKESGVELTTRIKVLFEIVSSEETYVRNLSLAVRAFQTPLQTNGSAHGVSSNQCEEIFFNLDAILEANSKLLQTLQTRVARFDAQRTCVGELFGSSVHGMRALYVDYVRAHQRAIIVVNELEHRKPAFNRFVERQREEHQVNQGMLSLLISPVQRVPRYRLLLRELLKHTSSSHMDFAALQRAHDVVSAVGDTINEAIREQENFQKVVDIQAAFEGSLHNIVAEGRSWVRDATLLKACRGGLKPRRFFLFNDCLVYASETGSSSYSFHRMLDLASTSVERLDDEDGQGEPGSAPADGGAAPAFGFTLISTDKSFKVYCDSLAEQDAWWTDLSALCSGHRLRGHAAPVWTPDATAPGCQLCASKFTMVFRRHHCRKCGKVVCAKCSSNRLKLNPAKSNDKAVRVCTECFGSAQASEEAKERMRRLRTGGGGGGGGGGVGAIHESLLREMTSSTVGLKKKGSSNVLASPPVSPRRMIPPISPRKVAPGVGGMSISPRGAVASGPVSPRSAQRQQPISPRGAAPLAAAAAAATVSQRGRAASAASARAPAVLPDTAVSPRNGPPPPPAVRRPQPESPRRRPLPTPHRVSLADRSVSLPVISPPSHRRLLLGDQRARMSKEPVKVEGDADDSRDSGSITVPIAGNYARMAITSNQSDVVNEDGDGDEKETDKAESSGELVGVDLSAAAADALVAADSKPLSGDQVGQFAVDIESLSLGGARRELKRALADRRKLNEELGAALARPDDAEAVSALRAEVRTAARRVVGLERRVESLTTAAVDTVALPVAPSSSSDAHQGPASEPGPESGPQQSINGGIPNEQPSRVRALVDLSMKTPGKLSFRRGDVFEQLSVVSSKWATGRLANGSKGLFPRACVEPWDTHAVAELGPEAPAVPASAPPKLPSSPPPELPSSPPPELPSAPAPALTKPAASTASPTAAKKSSKKKKKKSKLEAACEPPPVPPDIRDSIEAPPVPVDDTDTADTLAQEKREAEELLYGLNLFNKK